MEISDVRKRVNETIEHAKRAAAERRTRVDEATREFEVFLDRIAMPLFRQIANVLRAEGYPFTVSRRGGSVRLVSDRSAERLHRADARHDRRASRRSSATQPQPRPPRDRIGSADRHGGPVRDSPKTMCSTFVLKELEPWSNDRDRLARRARLDTGRRQVRDRCYRSGARRRADFVDSDQLDQLVAARLVRRNDPLGPQVLQHALVGVVGRDRRRRCRSAPLRGPASSSPSPRPYASRAGSRSV